MDTPVSSTWGGRFAEGPSARMRQFSESISFDCRLWRYDIRGSQAHAKMLAHAGLITVEEGEAIRAGLEAIGEQIARGEFDWDLALEDVHMNLEQALTQRVPAGAKLHTGRSRNDQVATDVRLFLKDACNWLRETLLGLQRNLLNFAERHREVVIPGYTHLQRAQPVPAAHHILAWMEMFARDRERLAQVRARANVCPLGAGALAGSTLPLDRAFAARELGFVDGEGRPRLTQNSMDAVASRDLYLEFVQACALVCGHLSRIAEDMILWNSSEFGFLELPDAFTTGSSLMPQKKNPDALELIRGKAARVAGAWQTLFTLQKGLPLTYNRDLQEDKPPLFDAFDQAYACTEILRDLLPGARLRLERCAAAVSDPLLLATDLAEWLVARGVAFREAHHLVGALVAAAEKLAKPLDELTDAEAQAISKHFAEGWREVFDVQRCLRARRGFGMAGTEPLAEQITAWRERLA